ncbi:MAG: HEPN domain-containing protein [Bacteroidota bacterium]
MPDIRDTVCFHCQQAAEKFIKGYLVHLGIEFRFSHNLQYLLALVQDMEQVPQEFYDLATDLEDFGVFARYPKLIPLPSDPELEDIFLRIEDLRQHFYSKIP